MPRCFLNTPRSSPNPVLALCPSCCPSLSPSALHPLCDVSGHTHAVRFLEAQRPVDVEAAAAAAVEDIKQEEWQLDAIEKRKEQQVRG